MSEQTESLCTTDACESLRARLAKYEDAEGRPVVVPEPYGWVAAGGFYSDRETAIAAAGKTPCIDVYSRPQMDVSEDRSLQRQAIAEYLAKELDSACAEIRALKAQPSGVVLPERKREDRGTGDSEVDGYYNLEAKAYNEALDAVARLNSPAVFAGDREVLLYLMDRFDHEVWVCPRCSHEETTSEMDSASYLREYLAGAQHASAGGVDERAAFEAAAAETYKGWAVGRDVGGVYGASSWTGNSYMNAYTDLAWELWKKARALSAPSHGELEVLREYRTAIRNFNDCHGVETDTLEEAVEIERKAEARLESAEKACHDFYAGRELAPNHSEQVHAVLAKLFDAVEWATNDMGNLLLDRELQDEVRALLDAAPSAGSGD